MRKFLLFCLILWAFIFTVPLAFFSGSDKEIPELLNSRENEDEAKDSSITVSLLRGGKVESIALDAYLEGVVAAEMPALFPDEALKAQAVAARTYTMKKLSSSPADGHNGAAVCDNPAHCKAYNPISSYAEAWSSNSESYTEKIRRAVKETDGEILLYDGEPISAVFHSTSSGMTENSKDIWGGDVPYLVSVKSDGDESSPHFQAEKSLSPEDFKTKFLEKYPDAKFDENPENWLSNISRSTAGSIKTVSIGGVNLKGSEVRSLFGLNSANFTLLYKDGNMVFTTRGYGHGVGMSQYGARALALDGKKYDEILKTYYTGVVLGKIS